MSTLTTHKSLMEPTSPKDPLWQRAPTLLVTTFAVPHGMQTSEYLLATYGDGEWGHVTHIQVKGCQTRHNLNLLMEFSTPKPDTQFLGPDHFLDRVAVFFPTDANTAFMTMGSAQSPGIMWSWRADGKIEKLETHGAGTIKPLNNEGLRGQSMRNGDRWHVMLSGPQISDTPRQFALAAWSGAHKERAGLKAISNDWIRLDAL